jgi:hypothetical protein
MSDQKKRKLSKAWIWIWLAVSVVTMAYYPLRTSFIRGWVPWSMVISFGWMWVIFVIGILFCRGALGNTGRNSGKRG